MAQNPANPPAVSNSMKMRVIIIIHEFENFSQLAMLNRQNLVVKRTLTGGPSHIFMPYFDGHTHCYINVRRSNNSGLRDLLGEKHTN